MKILYCPADMGGCAWYRLYLPSKYMAGLHQTTFKVHAYAEEFKNYDLIIIQRQKDALSLKKYIEEAQARGKIVAYEIDDYIWDVPSQVRSSFSDLTDADILIKTCKAVITSTQPLAENLKRLNPNVHVIPNYIEDVTPLVGAGPCARPEKGQPQGVAPTKNKKYPPLEKGDGGGFEDESPPLNPLLIKEGSQKAIRIGYAGSISHEPDFDEEIIKALQYIKDEYKEKVELVFLGYMPDVGAGLASALNIEHHPFVPPPEYLSTLYGLSLDIGLIPCQVNTFNHCRSNIKYLEYSIAGAATIASPVYPYNLSIMRDRGIVVKENRRDWWSLAIETLIEDEEKRLSMANNAYNFVKDNYLIKNKIAEIDGIYKKIAGNKKGIVV